MASLTNVKTHMTRVAKLRVKILMVDPAQRIIDVAIVDGNARRLAMFDIDPSFVWPREGEEWSIYEENGDWVLGKKFLNADENGAFQASIPGMSILAPVIPGDLKLTAAISLQYGWLEADGSFVDQIDYPELFALIGHSQNGDVDPEDGTFKLPDPDPSSGLRWLVKT